MKTFRQNLNIWLEDKKNSHENDEIKNVLEEVQKYIKTQEKEEEHMVNNSYTRGYHDRDLNKRFNGGYYKVTYKTNDFLKNLINK
jgi:hypothetical protein